MAKIKLPVGNEIWEVDVIEYDGRAWIVPRWIVSADLKSMRPLRIIAPRFAPGYAPIPGIEILQAFATMPLPPSLLERGVIPTQLEKLVEVRESPDISVPNPDAFH